MRTTVEGYAIGHHIDGSIGSTFDSIVGNLDILQQLDSLTRLSSSKGISQYTVVLSTNLSHSLRLIEILDLQSILQLDIIIRSHSRSTSDGSSIVRIRHSTNYSFLKDFVSRLIPNGQSKGLAISRVNNFASIRQACKEFSQPDIKTVGGINNRTIAVIIIDNHRINSRIINLLDEVDNASRGIGNPLSIAFIIVLISYTEVISDSYAISFDIHSSQLTSLLLLRKHMLNYISLKVVNRLLNLGVVDSCYIIISIRGIEEIFAHGLNKTLDNSSKCFRLQNSDLIISRTNPLKDRIGNSSNSFIDLLKDQVLLSPLIDRITMEDTIRSNLRNRRLRRNMRYMRIVRARMHRNHSMVTNIIGPLHDHFLFGCIDEACINKHLIDYLLKVSHVIQTLQELDIPEEPGTDLVRPSSTRNGTIKVDCDLMDQLIGIIPDNKVIGVPKADLIIEQHCEYTSLGIPSAIISQTDIFDKFNLFGSQGIPLLLYLILA